MNCPQCGYSGPHSHNHPVYRTVPRSHAHNCPCGRCVQVRGPVSKRSGGGPWLIWPLLLVIGGICGGIKEITYHPAVFGRWAAVIGGIVVIILVVVWLCKRFAAPPGPPQGRLRVEAIPPDRLRAAGLPDGFSVEEELAAIRAQLRNQP